MGRELPDPDVSLDDMMDAVSTGELYLICARSDDARRLVIEGSELRTCSECGSSVWVAPSSLKRVTKLTQIICRECLMPVAERNGRKIALVPSAEDQKQEVRRALDQLGGSS